MNKSQIIKKYGIEGFKQYKAYRNDNYKNKYHNDPVFRETNKALRTARRHKHYVENGRLDLIENYKMAANDHFKG